MSEFVRFACPSCGKRLKTLARKAGRTARCACGHSFRVPSADPRVPPLLGSDDPESVRPDGPRPHGGRPDRGEEDQSRSEARLPWMIGGVVVLLAVGIGGAVVATRSPRQPAVTEGPSAATASAVEPKRPAEPPNPGPKDRKNPPEDAKPSPPPNAGSVAPEPAPAPPKANPARPDPELQGAWTLSMVYDQYEAGHKSGIALTSKYLMTIRDGDVTVETEIDGKKEVTKYSVDSDLSKTPKVYRRATADGKYVVTGIYAVRDGQLLMCFQGDGTIPEAFVANRNDGKGRRISEFDRVKSEGAARPPGPVAPVKPAEPPKAASGPGEGGHPGSDQPKKDDGTLAELKGKWVDSQRYNGALVIITITLDDKGGASYLRVADLGGGKFEADISSRSTKLEKQKDELVIKLLDGTYRCLRSEKGKLEMTLISGTGPKSWSFSKIEK